MLTKCCNAKTCTKETEEFPLTCADIHEEFPSLIPEDRLSKLEREMWHKHTQVTWVSVGVILLGVSMIIHVVFH